MVTKGTQFQKESAIAYLGGTGSRIDDIGAILRDPGQDPWVRATAASVLRKRRAPAQEYYMDIVKLLLREQPVGDIEQIKQLDIDQLLSGILMGMSSNPFEAGLLKDKKDKDLFYRAVLKLADHKRMQGRGNGMRLLHHMPLEDFHIVADKVMHVIEDKDPTYHSYHNPSGPVVAAITILANLNIKEGIPLAMKITENPSGKWSFKMKARWACLAMYGAHAKPHMEKLKAAILNNGRGGFALMGKHKRAWDAMVRAIENDKTPRKLISLEEAKRGGKGLTIEKSTLTPSQDTAALAAVEKLIAEKQYLKAVTALRRLTVTKRGTDIAKQAADRLKAMQEDPAISLSIIDAKADAFEGRCVAAERKKDYALAIKLYEQYIQQFAKATRFESVKAHLASLKSDKAILAAVKSGQASKECKRWLGLAESYAASGLTDKAKQYLTKIIEKYGDTDWGTKARARLAEIDGR